ncbi:MAG: T9SS type A sorting domain-containing protein, partial [Parafilimonas sp.]
NGEVVISIAPNSNSSQYGLIGALLIQEYGTATNGSPVLPQSLNKKAIKLAKGVQQSSLLAKAESNKVVAYPNPFNHNLSVSVNLDKADNIKIQLLGINGKPVYVKDFGKLQQGAANLVLMPAQNISAGVYFIKIIFGSGKIEFIKVVKQ